MSTEQLTNRLVDIGWIVAGGLERADREAVEIAREGVLSFLREKLPDFEWRMSLLERRELAVSPRVEPVALLDEAVIERNLRRWDFTVVVTGSDLISHYKTDAIGALSRSLEGAVISTRRIDPWAKSPSASDKDRIHRLARRIQSLVLHCLARFCGLDYADDPASYLAAFETSDDLDQAATIDDAQIDTMRRDLSEVADQRLEERAKNQPQNTLSFYLRAAWINRSDIWESLLQARPWQFPYRLSRLTTAAVSTLLILLITAEAWDLGMSQTPAFVGLLSMASVLFTGCYTLVRQNLLVRREHRTLTEQNVVTNTSTIAIVFAGILTTYLLLFLLTFLTSRILFTDSLADNWSASVAAKPTLAHYLTLAAFDSSLGIFIGSLGASFEHHHYFRHVTFVDEEV